jgi:hypothetical protein
VRTRAELYRDFMGIKSLPGDEDFLRDDAGAGAGSRDGATPEALADASQFPLLAAQRASPRSPALAAQPAGAGAGAGLAAGAAASPAVRPAPPSFAFVAERGHTTMAFPTLAEASALNVRGKSGGGGGGGGGSGGGSGSGADGAAPRKGAWGRP